MDGRTAAWLLLLPITMLSSGCWTTQKSIVGPAAGNRIEETPVRAAKNDGPRRNPLPATEIAFGKMKEGEADSAALKQHPETRALLRDEARKAYQQALKIDPNNLEAQRCLGKLYAKMGDHERAQEIYKKAMAKHPKDAGLWFDLGLCHNRKKDFNESVRCFTKAVELEPENREYRRQLGFTLAWTGQIEPGLAQLTRVHGVALAHYKIACIYDQKEQREAAIHHLQLALRENSQLQEARELLDALSGAGPRTAMVTVQ